MIEQQESITTKIIQIKLINFAFVPSIIECDGRCQLQIKIGENKLDFTSRIYDEEERTYYLTIEEQDFDFPPLKKNDIYNYSLKTLGKYTLSCINYSRIKPCTILLQIPSNKYKTNSYMTDGDKSTVIDNFQFSLTTSQNSKFSFFKEIESTFMMKPRKHSDSLEKESFEQLYDDKESISDFQDFKESNSKSQDELNFSSKHELIEIEQIEEDKELEVE